MSATRNRGGLPFPLRGARSRVRRALGVDLAAQLRRTEPAHAARARVPGDASMNQLATAPLEAALQSETDALWYKDAVIYQLHVKTFHDGNNDGFGDFKGLME